MLVLFHSGYPAKGPARSAVNLAETCLYFVQQIGVADAQQTGSLPYNVSFRPLWRELSRVETKVGNNANNI